MRRVFSLWSWLLWLSWFCGPGQLHADEICAICGKPIEESYYSIEDKVTLEKKHVCKQCESWFPDCFVCGLPANTNTPGFIQLPDQRALCARDAKTAVLREEDGVRICKEVHEGLDRLFSRFTSFPETNVAIDVMDRVSLQSLFKLAGNDYQCPNVWGLTETQTNNHRLSYRISLMTGLPLTWFQSTCAHEYGHTWIHEHVPDSRQGTLNRDAQEAFCELVSFLYMESLNDEEQKAQILRNAYTRGQIDLFVAAQRSYGFNEILDWMQFGVDNRLSAAEPNRIRKIDQQTPKPISSLTLTAARVVPTAAPDTLVLKAVFWDQRHPLAIINDHTLGPNEEARVRVGSTNILVHCLAISPDSVRVRLPEQAQETMLRLKSR